MLPNVFSALTVLAGLAAIGFALYLLQLGRRTRSWLPTPATILTSRVAPAAEGSVQAFVTYRYRFNGVEHESSRIRPIESSSSFKAPAQRVVSRYRPTQQVIAFVNPARPQEAFLEPGVQPGSLLFIVATGSLLFAVGAYRLLVGVGLI